MHILHVTPHLPPDQAANALLPWQLGNWAEQAGDSVEYVAHPPVAAGTTRLSGPASWVRRRSRFAADRIFRAGALTAAWRIRNALTPAIARADIVHVHSNGLLAELAVLLASRRSKPVILTLYGTEVWHYRRRRVGPDLFTRAYHAASCVTFYSERLLAHARRIGLTRRGVDVIYPPVGPEFHWQDEDGQAAARAALGVSNRHLLLNVKRLHPLAGQRYVIEAMNEVIRTHPDTRLIFCGTGPLLDDLKRSARSAGVERHVTFAGLVDNRTIARFCAAADLFVLPSQLEALPTVAVEALACGTPVLSTDNPGGLELSELFGPDVSIVPREQPLALAAAIQHFLQNKRRTSASTRDTIERQFRPAVVARRYRALYERLARGESDASGSQCVGSAEGPTGNRTGGQPMKLIERIGADMTSAMRARDQRRLAPLRMAKAALMNREVEKGSALDETEAQQVITSLIRQRRDSIEQFRRGGRADLADREAAEIETLEAYLPPPLDPAEIERVVDEGIAEAGAATARDLGRVMKVVMRKLAGTGVDGKVVNEVVRRKLGAA